MKKVILSVIVAASMGLTGCASIVSGTSQPVSVTSTPTGLPFTVTDGHGAVVAGGITPATVNLKRGEGSMNVQIKDKGNKRVVGQGTFAEGMNGWYAGNILIGGIVGLVIDGVDGAMWKYNPDHLTVGTSVKQ